MSGFLGLGAVRDGEFQHVVDRHGLWEEARYAPPRNEFGPLVNLGLIQVYRIVGIRATRKFIRTASCNCLATFIALLAAMGQEMMDRHTQGAPFFDP
jgi:hypothetical protein